MAETRLKDEKLYRLWRAFVEECPALESADLINQWDAEMLELSRARLRRSSEMRAIRIMTGLLVISRVFFELESGAQSQVYGRLRAHFRDGRDLNQLMGTVLEMQVACRIAKAGMSPEFIPEMRNLKSPDLLVRDAGVLVECKNLVPRDLNDLEVSGLCSRLRDHASKVVDQFNSYDPDHKFKHVAVFHLPPDPRGFLAARRMGDRMDLSLAASGSVDGGGSGSPGLVQALLVESSLTPLYDRPGEPREPMEYWHIPSPLLLKNPSMSLFVWHLFMAMGVCPFEGFRYPLQIMSLYLHGQSEQSRATMDLELARRYWREWNERTGNRFEELDVPHLSAFPTNWTHDGDSPKPAPRSLEPPLGAS